MIMAKYHMRRVEKEIKNKEIIEILKNGKYSVISMSKENEPYLVTLSYGYDQALNALYFHCAKEGQKMDFIKSNPNICGTVIEDNGYEEGCGQVFRSVVFRGKIKIIDELEEKKRGFDILINQLETDSKAIKDKFLKKDATYENSGMLRLDITDITGKEEKAQDL
jgi:nitroimidazol reductase NimA-like FMN-containing flavoprotein (pyridoxamine 5'-phosphate oxidase superfamily)